MRIFGSLLIGLLFCFLQLTAAYYQGNGDIQNEYVRTGSNATLYCQPATDVDNINRIVWYKEDKKIGEVVNGRRTYWDAGTHVNLQTHNNALYFRRVTYPDSGEYYCEINGKRTRSSLARLLVQGKEFAILKNFKRREIKNDNSEKCQILMNMFFGLEVENEAVKLKI